MTERMRHDTPREVLIAATVHGASSLLGEALGDADAEHWNDLDGLSQAVVIAIVRRGVTDVEIQRMRVGGVAVDTESDVIDHPSPERLWQAGHGVWAAHSSTPPSVTAFARLSPSVREQFTVALAIIRAMTEPEPPYTPLTMGRPPKPENAHGDRSLDEVTQPGETEASTADPRAETAPEAAGEASEGGSPGNGTAAEPPRPEPQNLEGPRV